MIYFDNSSTTSVRPEVVAVYTRLLTDSYANADSLHQPGRGVLRNMEASRDHIARMLKCAPGEILFTGSASESNTLAAVGYALANQNRGRHILTSNVEHSSTAHAMDYLESLGFEVERLPINEEGIITPELVKSRMRRDTILVSLMHVNNEMGAINPIGEIADIVHESPTAAFHADCVQSFAKVEIPFEKLDLMTMSAHKIHGLKGSALLKKKEKLRIQPVIFGGQQEQGLRGGTSNSPVNTVLAKTIRLALEEQPQLLTQTQAIKDYIIQELSSIPGFHVHSPVNSVPYILNLSFDQISSQVFLNALDARGICVSARSTCSSHDSGASQVLLAMNKSEKDATHAIRLSFGITNTLSEAAAFVNAAKEIIKQYGLPL